MPKKLLLFKYFLFRNRIDWNNSTSFLTLFPLVHPCSFYLSPSNLGEKTKGCKLNIKDQCFLHSYIYNDNKNIYMFIKNVKWKKNVYAFLIKKTPNFICWTRLKTEKLSASFTQLVQELCFPYQRTLFSVWKIRHFFVQQTHR